MEDVHKQHMSMVGGSPLMGWGTRQQNFHPGAKRTESRHDKAGFSATIVEMAQVKNWASTIQL